MTKNEIKIAAELLNKASDAFSKHGCNDFDIPNTLENRMLVRNMQIALNENVSLNIRGGKIWVQDWIMMAYLADKMLHD